MASAEEPERFVTPLFVELEDEIFPFLSLVHKQNLFIHIFSLFLHLFPFF